MPYIPNCCSEINFLSNISIVQVFEWNVLSTISVSKLFEWEVGEGPLYWYQIESCATNICPSTSYDYNEIRTIAATSLENLCIRLNQIGFNRKIKSIKRWSKPTLICDISNIEECNNLVSIDLDTFNCSFIEKGCSNTSMGFNIYLENVNTGIDNLHIK